MAQDIEEMGRDPKAEEGESDATDDDAIRVARRQGLALHQLGRGVAAVQPVRARSGWSKGVQRVDGAN